MSNFKVEIQASHIRLLYRRQPKKKEINHLAPDNNPTYQNYINTSNAVHRLTYFDKPIRIASKYPAHIIYNKDTDFTKAGSDLGFFLNHKRGKWMPTQSDNMQYAEGTPVYCPFSVFMAMKSEDVKSLHYDLTIYCEFKTLDIFNVVKP